MTQSDDPDIQALIGELRLTQGWLDDWQDRCVDAERTLDRATEMIEDALDQLTGWCSGGVSIEKGISILNDTLDILRA